MFYDPLRQRPACAGFVLAGGGSLRMGRDKALVPFSGKPLAAVIAERVEQAAGSVAMVGSRELYGALGWPVIEDQAPGCGPLSGIHAALKFGAERGARWNLIVACDLPFLSLDFLRYLLEIAAAEDQRPAGESAQVVVPRSERGYELAAAFRADATTLAADNIARGDCKLSHLYERLRCRFVTPAEWAGFDPGGLLFENVNTPEDLARARKRFSS